MIDPGTEREREQRERAESSVKLEMEGKKGRACVCAREKERDDERRRACSRARKQHVCGLVSQGASRHASFIRDTAVQAVWNGGRHRRPLSLVATTKKCCQITTSHTITTRYYHKESKSDSFQEGRKEMVMSSKRSRDQSRNASNEKRQEDVVSRFLCRRPAAPVCLQHVSPGRRAKRPKQSTPLLLPHKEGVDKSPPPKAKKRSKKTTSIRRKLPHQQEKHQ